MVQALKVTLRATFKYDVRRVHISHPHVITFGQHSTDIWKLSPDAHSIKHRVSLSPFVEHPGREGVFVAEVADIPGQGDVFVDEARDIIVIPNESFRPHGVWVYGLKDGRLIRKIAVSEDIEVCGMQYRDGRALFTADEYDNESPPNKQTTLHLCDVAGDGGLLRGLRLPPDLSERDKTSPDDSFVPLLLAPNGDIFATSSAYEEEKLALLRWEGSSNPQDEQLPSTTAEIAILLEGGNSIRPSCSSLIGESSFVVSAYEHTMDCLEVANGAQSTIHRIETHSLNEQWCAEPILGRIYSVQHVPSHDTILAIAKMDEREDGGDYDIATIVAALDASTGALRRMDKINFQKHGCPVKHCALVKTEESFNVIVLFADGGISVTPLDTFLSGGFARDGESICVSRALEGGVEVSSGAVGKHSAILVGGGDTEFSLVSW